MSSARILPAFVVTGLAACAHTQSESTFSPPDVRSTAPIIVVDAQEVPEGLDEHVMIIVDRDGLAKLYRNETLNQTGITSVSQSSHYLYRAPYGSRTRSNRVHPDHDPMPDTISGLSNADRRFDDARPDRMGERSRRSRR